MSAVKTVDGTGQGRGNDRTKSKRHEQHRRRPPYNQLTHCLRRERLSSGSELATFRIKFDATTSRPYSRVRRGGEDLFMRAGLSTEDMLCERASVGRYL